MLSLLLIIGVAQAAHAPQQSPPDFRQLDTFLTFTRTPSGLVIETQVRIGTFPVDNFDSNRGGGFTYWFDRTVRDLNRPELPVERSYTNSQLCPHARQPLFAAENLAMPHPDVEGYGSEWRYSSVDGVHYELVGDSVHADGQPGRFSIESNIGSPLAQWVETMLANLEGCWRPRQ